MPLSNSVFQNHQYVDDWMLNNRLRCVGKISGNGIEMDFAFFTLATILGVLPTI